MDHTDKDGVIMDDDRTRDTGRRMCRAGMATAVVVVLTFGCGPQPEPVEDEPQARPVDVWWEDGAEDAMDRLGDELEPIVAAVATRNVGEANRLCRDVADRYASLVAPLTNGPPEQLRSDIFTTINGIRTFLHRCSVADSASELGGLVDGLDGPVGEAIMNIDRTVWRNG